MLYSALIHLHQVNLDRKDCALVHNYMLYSCTAPLRWLQLNTSTGAVGTLDKGGQIGDAWGFWGRGMHAQRIWDSLNKTKGQRATTKKGKTKGKG